MERDDGKTSDDRTRKKDTIPSSATDYLNPRYWDERFSEEEHYEWFKGYSHFRHLVLQRVVPGSSVLELGCGNSQLCDNMFEDGIADITCIDLSATAVERMRKRLSGKGYEGIKVLEADMLDLPFPDEQYDVVIEKGTMDVLLVDSGDPWNPHPTTVSKVMQMLREVHRVLKSDGVFISITFGQPHFRRPLFESPELSWSVEWSTFGDSFHYFFYTLKKGQRSATNDVVQDKKLEVPSISLFHEELEGEDYLFRTNIDDVDS
ncbi:hypothetical protein MLD38_027009 [Melastoma candidum]|uniref:Uncharacterized protein n=1 Tax=Melastoma candidum TaxID=119954 RepID=A0ACB9P288_9MYRT|nr:hypothetical protein MLD38_027009 [Melastoma candidum]